MRLANLVELWGTPIEAAPADPAASFSRIGTDSRELETGCLFVPLVGERFDGHRFLAAALEQGALAALAQRDRLSAEQAEGLVRSSGGRIWLVEDTQAAYQQLGRLWRRQGKAPVIAVTGSAGKTTTRELIRAVLAPLGPVLASVGNENNDIGVPLTLLKAGAEHRAVVVEMGMRGLGEIERLSRCAEPDITVITNIGTAHIGRLGSREAIATAKCEIVAALRPDGLVVIPAGDPLLEASLAAVWSGRVIRVALQDDPPGPQPAQLLGRLEAGADGDRLIWGQAEPGAREHSTELPLPGRHNARNLLLALAVASELGVDPLRCTGWRWPCRAGAAGGSASGRSRCSMRPTTPPLKRCWRPWICWRPSRVDASRYWAPCSSWGSRAPSCTAGWESGPEPSGSMGW